jgi:glycosyltransferase involved in cell wall biosynthesis/GNAT superfamily N-acetyltransferase
MKILLFNTNNPLKESGIVALDLLTQLRSKGHEVTLMVNAWNPDYPPGIISMETAFDLRLKKWTEKFMWHLNRLINYFVKARATDPNYSFFVLNEKRSFYSTRKILHRAGMRPDAIFVLYAKNFLNIRNIHELYKRTNAPVYWLMYDMAPLTGGCHYAWDCQGYTRSCGTCPALYSNDPVDISHRNFIYKGEYIEKTDLRLIAGSEWQFRQAGMSSLFRTKPVYKILISMDPEVFKPGDKTKIRASLGIPDGKRVIFFGSLQLKELRKGMKYLFESLNILKEKINSTDPSFADDVILLIAGRGIDAFANDLPFRYHYMGMITDMRKMAMAYAAADVFISPSIEDSGPSMINQSLMSGTPVVSFEMGVSPDLVHSGITGHMARLRDSNDMAGGIYNIISLDDKALGEMSERCRSLAMQLFSPEARISKIEKLLKNGKHTNMSSKFKHLEWDTMSFGYKVASVNPMRMEESELNEIAVDLRAKNYSLAYFFADPDDDISNNSLRRAGALLADIKVTFSVQVEEINDLSFPDNIRPYPANTVSPKLRSLALQSGDYSRFKTDPGFKNGEFEKLYVKWIENSVSGEIAGEVFIYDEGNDEKGFITVSVGKNESSIGLIAVDAEVRGKSIGRNLINKALSYSRERGIKTVDVVTQMNNKGACEFYKALGFQIKTIVNVYHLWIK